MPSRRAPSRHHPPSPALGRRSLLGAVVLGVLFPGDAGAGTEDDSAVDLPEPVLTEETMPNEHRELSVRAGTAYRTLDGASFGVLPGIHLFYGLTEHLGAEVSAPLAYHSDGGAATYGVGDVSLGLKYLVISAVGNRPAVVLGVEAGIPTGDEDRDLGEGSFELTPFLALAKDLGPVSLQGNLGWSEQLADGERGRLTYNWALGVPFLEHRAHLLAEVNGTSGPAPDAAVAPGITYAVTDSVTVGAAAPIGLNRNTPDWGVATHVQIDVGT